MKTIWWIVTFFLLYVVVEIYWETHHFVITRYKVKTKKFSKQTQGIKIVFLSDLHNQMYGEHSWKLLNAIQKESPDLILIGGDMLVGNPKISYEPALDFIKQLPTIAPVYYGNGNHEQRMHEQKEMYGRKFWNYKEALEKVGVTFLINETRIFEKNGEMIHLTGIEIPKRCYQKFKQVYLAKAEMEERIGCGKEGFQILLAHHPGFAKTYWEWGADLILSGHLHGGVVRLPFLGAAISPQFRLFPRYSGSYYQEGERGIIVSKGLGMHTIKIRFWNPAEVVVFTLHGEG